jgi:transposase
MINPSLPTEKFMYSTARIATAYPGNLVVHPVSPFYDRGVPGRRCPMPQRLTVRPLTDAEVQTITRLAHARTASQREWQRARIVWLAHQGAEVIDIAVRVGACRATVRTWIKRFNVLGVAGLQDAPRCGGPATYPPEQVGAIIALSLTDPRTLGQPFGSWTLDRLVAYLREERGIGMKRSRLSELLIAEGLRWRTAEVWFSERADPAFAEKRGRSSSCAPPRPPGA